MRNLLLTGAVALCFRPETETGSAGTITPQAGEVRDLPQAKSDAPNFPAQIAALETRLASMESQLANAVESAIGAAKPEVSKLAATIEGWYQHLRPSFPHLPSPPTTPPASVETEGK